MSGEITYTDTYIHFPDNTYLYEQDVLKSDITGMIILWEGTVAPTGWAICDGTNGTPDLRGRFVVGYSSPDASFNSVGNTGGEKQHTLTIAEMPSHSHTLPDNIAFDVGSDNGSVENLEQPRNTNIVYNTGATGGDGAHENLPPYYVLSYIMCKTPSYIQNLIITGTYDTYSAAGKTYYVFKGDGTIRFNFSAKQLSCILVGGGGGGGPIRITGLPYVAMGAGGGGGQVTSYSFIPNISETYSITVGQGGQGAICSVSATKNTTSFVSGISIAATQGGSTLLKNGANLTISSALGGSPGLADGIAGTNYQSGGAAGIAQNCSTSAYFSDYGTIYTLGYNPTMYTSSTSGTNGIALSTGVIINGVTYMSLAGGGGGGNALEYRSFGTPAAVSGGTGGGGKGGSASYPINQTTSTVSTLSLLPSAFGIGMNGSGQYMAYTVADYTSGGSTTNGLIYISSDGGNTWTGRSPTPNISTWNEKVIISDDGNTIYCLKKFNPVVLYKSTNGGLTWTNVFDLGGIQRICGNSDASVIMVSRYTSPTMYIYISTGGGSFNQVYSSSSYQPTTIECGGSGNVLGVVRHTGTTYSLLMSTNGGTTWVQKSTPISTVFNIRAISRDDTTILLSGGSGGTGGGYLYVSTDGGNTWNVRFNDALRFWNSGSLSSNGEIQVVSSYTITSPYVGYIYLSIDKGKNWTQILSQSGTNQVTIQCKLSADGTKLFYLIFTSGGSTPGTVGIININTGTLGISGTSGTPNTGGGGGGAGQFENYMSNTLSYTAGMATSFTYNVNSYSGGSGVCVLSFDT